eukprot:CAMPEP_0184235798 /NCGR_PEP_ID=MMETSP0976-20121227/25500_1 /TAXON_ID=483370 /ORGANISM="non described non described, Strain CCMP2097" /LENGTH=58 /DNA_ID=CAMNT_0026540883 /DNA_START=18 /DNA_END=190 /DNA_ORIENTATION=+
MTSVINAQLLALGAIPLAASLMARGFGHAKDRREKARPRGRRRNSETVQPRVHLKQAT